MFTVNEICQYILPALFSRLDVNIKEGGSELAGWQSSTGAPASTTKNPSSGTVIHFTLPDSDSIFTVDTSLDGTKLAGSISDEHFTSETEQWLSLLKNLLECDTRGECVRKVYITVSRTSYSSAYSTYMISMSSTVLSVHDYSVRGL